MSGTLVVTTKDGTVWTRRGAFRGGEPLYAPQAICQCPEMVMATLPELAEHGIAGTADALPMPVGPVPQPLALPWAHAACAPHFQAIDLDLTATPEQWSAWQTVLSVDLRRTTQRGGGLVTSHATWRGIHVVIRCWLAEQPETAAVEAGDAR
jgi:hypothetical protein